MGDLAGLVHVIFLSAGLSISQAPPTNVQDCLLDSAQGVARCKGWIESEHKGRRWEAACMKKGEETQCIGYLTCPVAMTDNGAYVEGAHACSVQGEKVSVRANRRYLKCTSDAGSERLYCNANAYVNGD
jgi:hypothetical protein